VVTENSESLEKSVAFDAKPECRRALVFLLGTISRGSPAASTAEHPGSVIRDINLSLLKI